MPHLSAAYNLARWLLRDDQAAHDVVQESFLRAWRFYKDLRGSNPLPWLLGIVRNASYDWLRAQQAQTHWLVDAGVDDEQLMEAHADATANPLIQLEQRELRECINSAIADLAPAMREVIILREMHDMSYEQIAAITEVPMGTVMSRLARARAQLRGTLQAYAGSTRQNG